MLARRMDGGRRYEREERRQRDDWARVERGENKSAGTERETGKWVAPPQEGNKGKISNTNKSYMNKHQRFTAKCGREEEKSETMAL